MMTAMRLLRFAPGAAALAIGLMALSDVGRSSRLSTSKAEPDADESNAASGSGPSLIVDYRDDVTDADLAATPDDEQPISRWSAQDRVYRLTFASAREAAEAQRRLQADPRVEAVDWDVDAAIPPDEDFQEAAATNDRSMQAECGGKKADTEHVGFPSDPCYRYQWHLRQVGLPQAWKMGQGKGAIVAVIDTGVSRVPDLADTKFVPGFNFVNNTEDATDDHGHGTHVAGTIAQATHNNLGVGGVAFGASIMPLKVLTAKGSGSMAAIAQAIRFAADHGANVINMSLGGPFPVATIGKAVKYARSKGVTVIAAAGNDGRGRVSYPAKYPGVIAVAATQFDEATTFYSNWGAEVDIAAPGGNVRVDQNGDGKPDGVLQNTIVPGNTSTTDYLWFMGTSMATPHVAGVAALIVGAGVTQPDAVETILLGSARTAKGHESDKTGSSSKESDPHYGAGIVDADAALKSLRGRRGLSELGFGTGLALLGLGLLGGRNRGARIGSSTLGTTGSVAGFALALLFGSAGLFPSFPFFGSATMGDGVVGTGLLSGVDSYLPAALRGNALVWSALIPVAITGLLYGFRRLHGALAGIAFGTSGVLLFTALALPFRIALMPDLLARPWLLANAALSALIGLVVLKRDR